MEQDWKPGDVAMRVSPIGGPNCVAMRVAKCTATTSSLKEEPHWHFASPNALVPQCGSADHANYRPLVVIDPEDREQVERLAKSYHECEHIAPWSDLHNVTRVAIIDAIAFALREFANPTPPKPDEPLGDGAVVEDSAGRRWTRIATEGYIAEGAPLKNLSPPWRRRGMSGRWWDNLNAVRVLSEGVTS